MAIIRGEALKGWDSNNKRCCVLSILILIANYIVTALFWLVFHGNRQHFIMSPSQPKIEVKHLPSGLARNRCWQMCEAAPAESLHYRNIRCGKPVTLKSILGLITPDSGSIRYVKHCIRAGQSVKKC